MTEQQPEYLSRGNDYLGFIDATLRDLIGYATLANELVQNADDAEGAKSMVFDIRQEALVVQNDGVFTDCERPDLPECPYVAERGYRCDFHRFRWVAGGDKRNEMGTTGAFGIGFVAVYQVTDAPEVVSAGRHWIIQDDQEEAKRIRVCAGCGLDGSTGTTFILPWARDENSRLRQRLHAAAVTDVAIDEIEADLADALPKAMVFLKKLSSVEVQRDGTSRLRIERETDDDRVIVRESDGQVQEWLTISADFDGEAAAIRRRAGMGRVEDKRTANVRVAVPRHAQTAGLLFQGLPTQHPTGLPFHINADFFPSSDRKKIIFEGDFQSDWNRAAIRAAARGVAEALTGLRTALTPGRLWQLIAATAAVAADKAVDPAFASFWEEIGKALPQARLAYGTDEGWHLPSEVVLLQSDAERAAAEEFLHIGMIPVHEEVRPHVFALPGREEFMPLLTAARLAAAFDANGLAEAVAIETLPAGLRDSAAIARVGIAVEELLRPGRGGADAGVSIGGIALIPDRSGAMLLPPHDAFVSDDEAATLFGSITEAEFADPAALQRLPRIAALCPVFGVEAALKALEQWEAEELAEAATTGGLDVARLLRWFSQRATELEDGDARERLAALSIFPSKSALTTLDRLAVPGGFVDPLGLTDFVDLDALGGLRDFLVELGVRELTFPVYAADYLPRKLIEFDEALTPDDRRAVLLLIAERLGEIRDDTHIAEVLGELPLVETSAGWVPGREAYFDRPAVRSTLGDDKPWAILPEAHGTAVAEALRWLGVRESPRADDLRERIEELRAAPPSAVRVQSVQAVLTHIGRQPPDSALWIRLAELRDEAWLPARGDGSDWHQPAEIYSEFSATLFATQARFIDLPIADQRAINDYLEFLGVRSQPAPMLVVRHLRQLIDQGHEVRSNIYAFLDQNAADPAIDQLQGQPCLVLGGRPYRADQVYWGEHNFQPYRQTLRPEMLQFAAFLDRLGVKKAPDHRDAVALLHEIAEEAGTRALTDEQFAVVTECWRILDRARDDEAITDVELAELGQRRVVPDPRRILEKPDWLYFEDRPGLAKDLGPLLTKNVIARPWGAWRAMRAAGVQDLGRASELRLVECRNPAPSAALQDRLVARRGPVMRVIEAQTAKDEDVDRGMYDRVSCMQVDQLRVQFTLRAFGGSRLAETAPSDYHAVFVPQEETLYFVARNGTPPWRDVARELAYAVFPGLERGGPASGVKDALAAGSEEEAGLVLDELGYPRLADDVAPERGPSIPVGFAPPDESDVQDWDAYRPPPDEGDGDGAARGGAASANGQDSDTAHGTGAGTGASGTGGAGPAGQGTRPQTRLRSYVSPGAGNGSAASTDADDDDTDPAGVARVLEAERRSGRVPTEMPHHHPGYDVESRDESGEVVRYIEIKSTADVWGARGVGLSRRQFEVALEHSDKYWLYVVERASAGDFRIFRIQNPAGQAMWFFFDDGWRVVDGSVGGELMPEPERDTG